MVANYLVIQKHAENLDAPTKEEINKAIIE